MTRVEFILNVPDKLAKTVELCEKAVAKNRQITVFAPDADSTIALQQLLWQGATETAATSFLPSALATDLQAHLSPIVLNTTAEHLIQDDVLINLQLAHPPFFSRFRYLVEMVGLTEEDKAQARARFRFYRDRGYTIKTTDLAEAAVPNATAANAQ